VSLGWTASSGANYYVVQRSTLYNNGAVLAGGTLASGTEAYNTLSTITLTNTATGATYMDATPTNGSTYSYTVSAVNASGTGAASAAVTAQPEPAAPTTAPVVTATPGIQSATLSWGAVPGAEGYVIEMATSAGGPYTLVASVTELTYVVTGLDNNTTYYFEVFATNTGGSTSDSTAVSTTTPLGAPTGFSAAAGNTQVTLTWAPVSGATSYSIVESTATNGTFTNIGDSIGPSYTATALTNGTTYYFAVAAIDANGTGPDSTLASATPTANVPLAPTGLTATPGNAEVTLNWNASAGATSYDVQQAATTGGPYTVLNAAVTGTTYTSTGLSNGATYYYVVAATGTGGTGADSDQVSATPSGTGINLTWTGTSSTAWDTVTSNWLNGTSPTTYTDGDGVIFQDTALTGTVAISGTVSPASVSFNNSILNYIIDGAPIAGATGVIKTGSATLTFNNVNNYTGGTAVNAGTLALGVTSGTGGTAGSGVLTLAQGTTFAMNSPGNNFPGIPIQLSDGASATLYSANAANQYGGPISGAASSTLTFSGGVSLAVSGSEQFANYDGLVYIPSGSSIRFASTGGANGNGGSITSFEVDGTLYTRNSAQAGGVVLGSLAGSGTVSGQNANPAGTDTYFIGSNNADTTFSGSIVNGGSNYITAVTKVGDGTLILAGTCSYTGATIVEDGILEITGSVVGTTSLTIEDDGEVYLAGGTLSVAGNVTNEGIFKESGTNTISVTGTFENDGVLDLIDAPSTLPPNFVNDGTVLFASDSVVSGVSLSGSAFSVSVQSYTEHNYQLQRATSLSNPVWTNVGSAQAGTGSTLEFMDPSTTGSSAFYRILVSP
jgi:autotransporter-associated beta strand protein